MVNPVVNHDGFLIWVKVPVNHTVGLVWGDSARKQGMDMTLFKANDTTSLECDPLDESRENASKYAEDGHVRKR